MESTIFNEEAVRKKLMLIIEKVTGESITDNESSLFGFKYDLSSELMVYILLEASKEFNFEINDQFVDDLENYSFESLLNSILNDITN